MSQILGYGTDIVVDESVPEDEMGVLMPRLWVRMLGWRFELWTTRFTVARSRWVPLFYYLQRFEAEEIQISGQWEPYRHRRMDVRILRTRTAVRFNIAGLAHAWAGEPWKVVVLDAETGQRISEIAIEFEAKILGAKVGERLSVVRYLPHPESGTAYLLPDGKVAAECLSGYVVEVED